MLRPALPVRPRAAPVPALPSAAPLLLLPLCVLAHGALFWPAACLVAIAAAIARQGGAMLLWYGLALGFDADALVLAPFVVMLGLRTRAAPRMLALAAAVALAMLVARSYDGAFDFAVPHEMTMMNGAPTLWAIVAKTPGLSELPLTGLALTVAIGLSCAYAAWVAGCRLERRALLDAALLGAMLPVAMPGIAPPAFLLAALLAPIVARDDPSARRCSIAALVTGGTALAAIAGPGAAPVAALAVLAALWLHGRAVLRPAANDNPRVTPPRRAMPLPS